MGNSQDKDPIFFIKTFVRSRLAILFSVLNGTLTLSYFTGYETTSNSVISSSKPPYFYSFKTKQRLVRTRPYILALTVFK